MIAGIINRTLYIITIIGCLGCEAKNQVVAKADLLSIPIFPGENTIVERYNPIPFSGWRDFEKKANNEILRIEFREGKIVQQIQLKNGTDTLDYWCNKEYLTRNWKDGISQFVPASSGDSSVVKTFADHFVAKEFDYLADNFYGQIGELDFDKIHKTVESLIGQISSYKINAFVKESYNKGTHPVELFCKVTFISNTNSIIAGLLLHPDSITRTVVSINFEPLEQTIAKFLIEKSPLDGKQNTDNKLLIDSSGFHDKFFSSPYLKSGEYQYQYNGLKVWQLNNMDIMESITVTHNNKRVVFHLYWKEKDGKYFLIRRMAFAVQEYQPIWLISR